MIFQIQPRRLNAARCDNPRSTTSVKFGFTLLEIIIVISLLLLLAIAVLVFFNPKFQLEKTWDGKRKKELNTLQKVFEEYYNDKKCYPRPQEVCYDYQAGSTTCKICGNETTPLEFENLKSYLSRLPCDPQHPVRDYLYEVDNPDCPSLYRIYVRLSNTKDKAIEEVGCLSGCAPEGYSQNPGEFFNWGITSPNTSLTKIEGESSIIQFACRKTDGACIQCCVDINSPDCPEPTPCPLLDQDLDYCWLVGSLQTCLANCNPDCSTPSQTP